MDVLRICLLIEYTCMKYDLPCMRRNQSQSKPGIKMVYKQKCEELQRRHLILAGTGLSFTALGLIMAHLCVGCLGSGNSLARQNFKVFHRSRPVTGLLSF